MKFVLWVNVTWAISWQMFPEKQKLTNGRTHRWSLIGLKILPINKKFIKFDIAEFYPSISEDLLKKSINHAKWFTKVQENGISAIKPARKSLLFSKDGTWIKKIGNELFDVTMGRFDGAETCKLVGLYLLNKWFKLLGNDNVGFYSDDGLSAIKSTSGPILDKMRKTSRPDNHNRHQLNWNRLSGCGIQSCNEQVFPFRKPNNILLYINVKSNHPLKIKKDLPKMISKRLSELSCNKDEFDMGKPLYEKSL